MRSQKWDGRSQEYSEDRVRGRAVPVILALRALTSIDWSPSIFSVMTYVAEMLLDIKLCEIDSGRVLSNRALNLTELNQRSVDLFQSNNADISSV